MISVLQRVGTRDVYVTLEGLRLRFVAVGPSLTASDIAELRARKVVLLGEFVSITRRDRLGALVSDRASWPPDAIECFDERAAIMEFDGMLPREQAVLTAEICTRLGWRDRSES